MAMGPSAVFVIHHREGGERINVLTPPLMPSVEWDVEILKELDSLTVYSSYELNENDELILTYTDPNLEENAENKPVLDREFEQLHEILARATGRDLAEVSFEPCPCLIAAMMPAGGVIVMGVSLASPPSMNIADPFAGAPLH